jgi:polyribonucleotide nucleotidyltransferase
VVAGTQDAVLMVESEAKELSEEVMLGAVMFGHRGFQPVIEAIIRLAERSSREPRDFTPPDETALYNQVKAIAEADVRAGYAIPKKEERHEAIAKAKDKVMAALTGADKPDAPPANKIGEAFKHLEKDVVRNSILDTGHRIDGRNTSTVRQIVAEASVLPRTHGSALFTRGETQALVVTTLGTGEDEQYIDSLDGTTKGTFMLHYNFPPFSVGETGRMGATGRREIGVVSEITESNGSSSMATVCGSSLSLMDAGVPLKAPCAGIAMGLIKEGDRFAVLSDILGDEDHLGDMDFKVAGTSEGITSLQMDIKITGITEDIMKTALWQAKDGRLHILDKMSEALTGARASLGEHAPRIETLKIPTDKIREVIGTGGKVIREIVEKTGAKIDIQDDGTVKVASSSGTAIEAALKWIKSIVMEPEVGEIYDGKVVKVVDFGAFVNFFGARDGLVHVSELASKRVNKVSDVVNEGDAVKVKLLGFDNRGKVRLSMKQVDQATGEDISKKQGFEAGSEEAAPQGE